MKAVYIKRNFKESDIEKLNRDLKDCKSLLSTERMEYGDTILICDNITRKDKLEKINEKSN
jgi:hypothetical protein